MEKEKRFERRDLLWSVLVLCFLFVRFTGEKICVSFPAMGGAASTFTMAAVLLFRLFVKRLPPAWTGKRGKTAAVLEVIAAAFFALNALFGKYFDTKDMWRSFFGLAAMPANVPWILAAMAGGICLHLALLRVILSPWNVPAGEAGARSFSAHHEAHPYLWSWLILLAVWLPHLIVRFPGTLPYDTWNTIAQIVGTRELNTQHPLTFMLIVKVVFNAAVNSGVPWTANLAFLIANTLMWLFAAPYTLTVLKKMGVRGRGLTAALLFFALNPFVIGYIPIAYNDVPYSVAFLLLMDQLCLFLTDAEAYARRARNHVLTAAAVLFTFLRYNGVYVFTATAAVLLVREAALLIRKKRAVRTSAAVLLSFILPLAGGTMLNRWLIRESNAKVYQSRVMLAMPIQHVSRSIRDHRNELTPEEEKAIQAVLGEDLDFIAERYNPRNFDGAKANFRFEATREELLAFLKTWLGFLRRFPQSCLMASLNQNFYLFSILSDNSRYYTHETGQAESAYKRFGINVYQFSFNGPERQGGILRLIDYYKGMANTPVFFLLSNHGVYTLLLAAFLIRALMERDGRLFLLCVPLCATLGIIFVGPAIYNHPRYMFPIMYSMPAALSYYRMIARNGRAKGAA